MSKRKYKPVIINFLTDDDFARFFAFVLDFKSKTFNVLFNQVLKRFSLDASSSVVFKLYVHPDRIYSLEQVIHRQLAVLLL